jgi:hypothetical protein
MDKRHFTVVIGTKEHGLYVSSTPSSAAKKAVSKLCSSNKSKKVEFSLREITQGSKKKTYGPYLGEMKKLKTPIELKGRIIRYETIVHLKKEKSSIIKTVKKMGKKMRGGVYKCLDDAKIIGKLCAEDDSGEYDNIINCESACLEEKLIPELVAWKSLFKWCSENLPDNHIYCKGGSALGLEVLRSILNSKFNEFIASKNNQLNYTEFVTSKNNTSNYNEFITQKFNEFIKSKYKEFIDLKLIKDWDFTVFMTDDQKKIFIEHAETLGIKNQGQTIAILRYKSGLKLGQFQNEKLIGEDYLLELSVKTTETLDDLELPLTNLKFEVNFDNIDLFFEIVKMYVKEKEDLKKMLDILNQLINPIIVNGVDLVDSIENGLYTITDPKKISTAGLSPELLGLIDNFLQQSNNINNSNHINDETMKQFLITQLSQPDRLFLRFLKKNVEKTKKITKFYIDNGIPLEEWLINERVLVKIERKIHSFLKYLNSYIYANIVISDNLLNPEIDNTKKIKEIFKKFIEIMEILFKNINFPRLHNDKIDRELIEKLFPIMLFPKLKEYSLAKKAIKNQETLQKLEKEGKHNTLSMKISSLELEKTRPFNYTFYLPSGSGKYLTFINYYLNHIYKNR